MGKTVLMLCGDYAEDYEVMVPYQSLSLLGYTVHTVCPNKEAGSYVLTCVHDFEGAQTYSEKPGHRFGINHNFGAVSALSDEELVKTYCGLFIPGGRAPEYLRLNADVCRIVRAFVAAKAPIASICHGTQLLVTAAGELLKGVKLSSYPGCSPEITACGAVYVDVGLAAVCKERNIVCGQTWLGHPDLLREFVSLMGAKITIE